jgi:hypothetical protein
MLTPISLDNFKKFVNISGSTSMSNFDSFIEEAAQDLLIPILSKDLFENIQTNTIAYDEVFVKNIQRAICNFAAAQIVRLGAGTINNTGFLTVTKGDSKNASETAIKNTRRAYTERAYKEVEKILEFLEHNIDKPLYSLYKSSYSFQSFGKSLITTATEFNQYCPIVGFRRVFVLTKFAQNQEELKIRALLGAQLYNYLLLTPKENFRIVDIELMCLILPALAHLTIATALPQLALSLGTDDAISIFNNTNFGSQSNEQRTIDPSTIDYFVNDYAAKGQSFKAKIYPFLVDNKAEFEPYFTFPDPALSTPQFENKKIRKVYSW